MTRVMYVSFNDPDLSPGVFRKEQEFCDFFGDLGIGHGMEFQGLCLVTSLHKESEAIPCGRYFTVKKIPFLPYRTFSRIPLFCSLFRIHPVFSQAYDDISQYDPDVIIWRFTATSVPGVFRPKSICPRAILITEHQAKELEELRMTPAGRILSPLIKRNGKKVLGHVDAVLGVTSEITDYELALMGRNVPSLTLTNSIDVKKYPQKGHRQPSGDTLRLLYVGSNTTDWHGLDRILIGMAGYRGHVRLELHLAGDAGLSVKKLVRSLNLGDRVFFHGYCSGNALDMLFDRADLAVGTLGMHRKKLAHGSTLKVREYMARGIPFLISYIDDDLSPELPYVFTAPADDSPIDMDEVIRFSREIFGNHGENLSSEMRAYADEHMDYRRNILKLIDFIKSLSPYSHAKDGMPA